MTNAYAPFTEDQILSLNEYQTQSHFLPVTCGHCGYPLLATKDGWVCPNCQRWKQEWAHGFMADWSWKITWNAIFTVKKR